MITYVGDIVLNTIEKGRSIFDEEFGKNPEVIAIDCKGIHNLDSSGLGMLISFSKRAAERDMKIVLFDIPGEISQLFNISKLNNFFELTTGEAFMATYLS